MLCELYVFASIENFNRSKFDSQIEAKVILKVLPPKKKKNFEYHPLFCVILLVM